MGKVIDQRNAVYVSYHRRSHRFVFGENTVRTVEPSERLETDENGPLPVTHYLIDICRVHERIGIEWFNLHAPLEDGTGYYGYGDHWHTQRKRRNGFGLHPGTLSNGCVTISGSYDSDEWRAVKNYVSAGTLIYQGKNGRVQTFCGYLIVVDD